MFCINTGVSALSRHTSVRNKLVRNAQADNLSGKSALGKVFGYGTAKAAYTASVLNGYNFAVVCRHFVQ